MSTRLADVLTKLCFLRWESDHRKFFEIVKKKTAGTAKQYVPLKRAKLLGK